VDDPAAIDMQRNTVSVIIPYFNAQPTIGRAVRSALIQTVSPVEIIVVDDGSLDDVEGALMEFAAAVTLIRKPNAGAASARNVGIERAKGEWIAFLDADDYWEPQKLERQLAVPETVGLVAGKMYMENPGKPRSLAQSIEESLLNRIIQARGPEAYDIAMLLWTGVVLVRRSVLGDQRFVSGLEPAEDRDLWIRLVSSTSVYLVSEPLATYVQYADSLSNSDPDRDYSNMLKVVRRHAALLGPKVVRQQEAKVYLRWAARHLARGQARSAIVPAIHRLAIQPWSAQAWWIVFKALGESI
jgi:glycosyltransferase involved in cell wall biosynthesis